jgi:hypothetical protein
MTAVITRCAIAHQVMTNPGSVALITSIPVDHNRSAIVVAIPVAIAVFPDNDGLVAIPMIAVTVVFAIPVPIPVVARANGDATRTYADSDFFGSGRYRGTNSGQRNGHYC